MAWVGGEDLLDGHEIEELGVVGLPDRRLDVLGADDAGEVEETCGPGSSPG
jgi:hypothetical protein